MSSRPVDALVGPALIQPGPTHPLARVQPVALEHHPAAVYLARLAPGSRRTMRGALEVLARVVSGDALSAATLDWGALRYPHTTALRTWLSERYAPATANKMLAALRGVLKEAWRLGVLDAEAYHRAVDVGPVRGTVKPSGRALSAHEMSLLFAVCAADPRPVGIRDATLVAFLYGMGLRRCEVVALTLADWDEADDTLWVVRGKGRQARPVYLPPGARMALLDWLAWRGRAPGPLFWPFHNGRPKPRALSAQAVYYVLQRRAHDAGVAHFSPHDLRRTFISDLLDAGADLSAVQTMAGHASIHTTTRYDRRGAALRRKTATLLVIPYRTPARGTLSGS